jgi:hypothetical protein
MRVHRLVCVLVGSLAVVSGGCEDGDWHRKHHFLEPSPFVGVAPFVGATVLPSTIGFAAVPVFGCPLVAPFTSSFSLVVNHGGGPDLFMDRAAFRFVDGLGLPSPLDLTRPDLVGMFGSTFVASGATRTFHFRPQFGCGFVAAPRSVFLNLTFVDRSGGKHHHATTAFIK